jgi:hypothetical protein
MLAEFGVGQALWTMIWFFLFIMWIMLVFRVFADIFRSSDMSGVAKAVWALFIIFLPFIGVLSYLIARGGKMADNEVRAAEAQQSAVRSYIQNAAGTSVSAAEELAKLASLKEQGVIDEADFQRLKSKIVS